MGYVEEANKKRLESGAPTVKEVVKVAQEEWEKLPWKRMYDMIDGIPRRVQAVINAGGERTKH